MAGSSKRQAASGKPTWSKGDDERLRSIMQSGPPQSWLEIAQAAFPDGQHDQIACLDRWKLLSKPKSHKGPWTGAEDAALTNLVAELGPEKWVSIAARLTTRSGKQCRERWHNHLDPMIKKGPFTPDEDAIIFDLYGKIGSKWAEMARSLPGRPDNAIKNHFNTSLQRSKRRNSTASVTSSTSSASNAPSPKAVARYTPYKSRKRQSSTASSSNAPTSPSPLSPMSSLSRSASPVDARSPSTARRPILNMSLGRNLDKDFFSPSRHATSGFIAHGPLTAPADDRFSWSGSAGSMGPIDPSGGEPEAVPMQGSRSSTATFGSYPSGSSSSLASHDPHSNSSSSLTHSLSATSLACSSSSSSPSTPSPGVSSVQPIFSNDDYEPYAPPAYLTDNSPPRTTGLQRTNSLPCYPMTPSSPTDSMSHSYMSPPHHHFSPFAPKMHPASSLSVEIGYEPSEISTYWAEDPFGRPVHPNMFMPPAPYTYARQYMPRPAPIYLPPEEDGDSPTPSAANPEPYLDYVAASDAASNFSGSPESTHSTIAPQEYKSPRSVLMASPGSLAFDQASRALSAALPQPGTPYRMPLMHQVLSTPQNGQRSRNYSSPGAIQQTSPFRSPISPPSHAPDYMGSPISTAPLYHPRPKRLASFIDSQHLDTSLELDASPPIPHGYVAPFAHPSHHFNPTPATAS